MMNNTDTCSVCGQRMTLGFLAHRAACVGDLQAHRKVNMLDRCPKCEGALDTGWECTACGYDAQGHVVSEETRVLTAEKLREEAAKAEARGAVAPKSRWT